MNYFLYIGCAVLTKEICQIVNKIKSTVDLWFLPAGLHCQPTILNGLIQSELERAETLMTGLKEDGSGRSKCQAVLVGYGLCQQAVLGLKAGSIPLVLPRAHDCINILLGSVPRYQRLNQACPGNYWYSAGWLERLMTPGPDRDQYLKQDYQNRFDREQAEFLLDFERAWEHKYQQATLITWDLPELENYRRFTRNCATHLDWNYHEEPGDPGLLTDFLSGDWDPERFLIVEPGERVVATFDEKLIGAEKYK